jgi:16S rRNA (cytidine1402-2'-O)-methyltransferase
MPATLYIVSTPIGNLEDITLRAIRILKEVAAIAAEDTRHTRVLLARYDIRTPTTSFHEHNEAQKVPALIARLDRGESLALVSDAGTPAISDPGYRLIRAALEAGHRVQAVPGPSAVLGALVSSGFPTDAFTFLGFAPRKPAARREWAARVAAQPHTTVFFETPHRIRQTLEALSQELGNRPICIARELTKVHESSVVRPISDILRDIDGIRGEIAVVVPPLDVQHNQLQTPEDIEISHYFCHVTESERLSRRGGITKTAKKFGLTPNNVYVALERAKKQRRPASA